MESGHDAPGDKVDHAGNPASDLLRDWLWTVSAWSAAHPTHAPLLVMFDLKDMPPGTQTPNVVVKVGVPGAGPGDPVTWTDGPRPTTIARRNGAGVNQTDRITLIWRNGAGSMMWE